MTDQNGAPERRKTWRMGTKERGRLQAAVVVGICVLLVAVLRPYLLELIETRDFQVCQSNTRRLAQAIRNYAQDWDDTLPVAATWTDAALSNMASVSGTGYGVEAFLKCPRDHTKGRCSYAFNDLMSGVSLSVLPNDPVMLERRKRIGRLDRAALVVEVHGSPINAPVTLPDWSAVQHTLTRPHHVPLATGSVITGNLTPTFKNDDQLSSLAGKRY